MYLVYQQITLAKTGLRNRRDLVFNLHASFFFFLSFFCSLLSQCITDGLTNTCVCVCAVPVCVELLHACVNALNHILQKIRYSYERTSQKGSSTFCEPPRTYGFNISRLILSGVSLVIRTICSF